MKMFEDLPDVMNENHEQGMEEVLLKALDVGDVRELAMRCGGCGAKIGADVLSQVLGELDIMDHPQVLVGLNSPDDAAVLSLPSGHHWVQTVDVLKNFMDDPYLFGQLSALHAMSDVFAMNAQVQSAQALVQLPLMAEALQVRDMKQLMAGALKVLQEHGCALVGGHSSEDQVLGLGFAINGVIESEGALSRKRGLEEGQVLILTKALGTGALFAAHMRARAKGEHVEAALASMLRSNQKAAQVFNGHGATAVTDVTGFGLLGHMAEMCKGSEFGVKIDMDALPQLEGVSACFEQQIFSSLQPHNQRFRRLIENQETIRHHCHYPILFDPQTCGGLLGAVSKSKAKVVIEALVSAGYGEACVVATVLSHGTGFVVE
jgi:selenide,water dikinase